LSKVDPYFGNLVLKGFQEAESMPLPPWGAPTVAWYVLLAALLALLLRQVLRAMRAYRANAYRRAALTALNELRSSSHSIGGDLQPYIQQLMVLLKSTALQLGPRHQLAALDAQQCLRYLNRRQLRDFFGADSLQLVASAYGRSAVVSGASLAVLEGDIEQWLRTHTTNTENASGAQCDD